MNLGDVQKGSGEVVPAPDYNRSKLTVILSLAMFTTSNAIYATNQSNFFDPSSPTSMVLVSLLTMLAGAALLAFSAISFLSAARHEELEFNRASKKVTRRTRKVIADVLFENKKVFSIAFLLYAAFFSFIDGIAIYQPSVDFFQAYGVSATEGILSFCCGYPGYVPSLSVFFPAQHLGILIIPINVLLMILVSALVASNLTLLYRATGLSFGANGAKSSGGRKGSIGMVGAITGLFTGCPTCAAAFFLSMLAGSGATAFSFYISQYQLLIIGLTLPVLAGSIYWQAKSIRILMEGCSV